MRVHPVLALLLLAVLGASCRQILGIDEATLICPEELSDCALCTDPEDCGPVTECHSWRCVDALCTPVNIPARTQCSTGVCSDSSPSECAACVEDADCRGPSGAHCGLGECFRCDDGVQNGREHGVDCGGPCKNCLGAFCASPGDCISGFCADGRCCTSPCTDICASCGFPDPGNCTALPKYADDSDPVCDGKYVCSGGGSCGLRPGEICIAAVDCANGLCVDNRCVKSPGEECNLAVECAMMSCVNGVCTI
jgi:hypothetical protein